MLDDVANSIRGDVTKHADKLKILKKGQDMNRENMTKLKDQVEKCVQSGDFALLQDLVDDKAKYIDLDELA